jgi:hypothetical protein
MSLFTVLHKNAHDMPLIFRALIKRFYAKRKWDFFRNDASSLKSNNCIILVNGPSLEKDILIAVKKIKQKKSDVICVNYSALTDIFFQVKPNLYALADPIFWRNDTTQEFTDKNNILFDILKSAVWEIKFLVPEEGAEMVKKRLGSGSIHSCIPIPVNMAPIKNMNVLLSMLDKMVCTPIYGNVLILSLYYSIMSQYKDISVYGADFDVFKQLQTDQITNYVFSGGNHFYDNSYSPEPNKYLNRSNKMMHDRLGQAQNAFFQIYTLALLAKKRKISLKNRTSFSLIDSLDRGFDE